MRPPTASHFARVSFALLAALALTACTVGDTIEDEEEHGVVTGPDAAPADECEFSEPASVVVGGGTAASGFESLLDGAEMLAILAPSGKYMVTPAILARGIAPGEAGRAGHPHDPLVRLDLYRLGERVGGSVEKHLGLIDTPLGAVLLEIFTTIDVPPEEFADKTIEIRATVTDVCDRTASGMLEVHVILL